MGKTIKGLGKLSKELNRMARDIPKNMDKLQKETIDVGYKKATEEVAIDTGELKSSIDKGKDGISVGAEHGVFLEYGTFKSPAQPFIRPAYEDMKSNIDRNLKDVVK